MDHSKEPAHDVLRALVSRVEALERRCARLELEMRAARTEADANVAHSAKSGERDAFDQHMAMLKALNDYSRSQRLDDLRARPETLAAIRAANAERNVFLVARGLPPLPDAYPELP